MISAIESAVKKIERSAVNKHKERLSETRDYILIDDFDLLAEQRGPDKIRRYTKKNSLEGAVMVPDIDGFWAPYNDIKD